MSNVREEVLARLRRVAKSCMVENYNEAMKALYDSTIWKTKCNLRHWFTTYLPHQQVVIASQYKSNLTITLVTVQTSRNIYDILLSSLSLYLF